MMRRAFAAADSLSAFLVRGPSRVQRIGIDRYGRTVVPMLLNGCGAVRRLVLREFGARHAQ